MSTKFTLVHISDLHFSEGADRDNPRHSHSIPHLQALEICLQNKSFDHFIVSGDISNRGDKESLLRARTWLYKRLEIGDGKDTGLELKPTQVGIIPGNHDAFNASGPGSVLDIWQKSLENYNKIFGNVL